MTPENFQEILRRSEQIMGLFPEMQPGVDSFVHPEKGLYIFLNFVGVQWRVLTRGGNGFDPQQWAWADLEWGQVNSMEAIMPGCQLLYTNQRTLEETEYRIYLFALPEIYRLIKVPIRKIAIVSL